MSGGRYRELCERAKALTQQATEHETQLRLEQAKDCRCEAATVMIEACQLLSGAERATLRLRIEEYMKGIEKLKERIALRKDDIKRLTRTIDIAEDATGYSYESIFASLLQGATVVTIQDPYIQAHHQCQNLVRLCEVFARHSDSLRTVNLTTKACDEGAARNNQEQWLREIATSLASRQMTLRVDYDENLHDRAVSLNNGWIVRLGRGLDYFKPAQSKLSIGSFDFHLRPCKQCSIQISFDEGRIGR